MEIQTLQDVIRHSVAAYSEQAAYRYKVKKEVVDKTYRELGEDSMAVSRMVESLGMKGKHIAILGSTTYQWIVSFFGVTNSGSVAVPVDAQLSAEAICELLERADVEMLFFDELRADVAAMAAERCPRVRYIVSFQAEAARRGENGMGGVLSWEELRRENGGEYETQLDPDQLCTILFTSGTTGKSKGVMPQESD